MLELGMKYKEKLLIILSFTLLTHYFVLTFFKVDSTESFTGKVEKIEVMEKGLFPTAKVNFQIEKVEDDGNKKIFSKTVSLVKNEINLIKLGRKYKVKSHHNWLVSLK